MPLPNGAFNGFVCTTVSGLLMVMLNSGIGNATVETIDGWYHSENC